MHQKTKRSQTGVSFLSPASIEFELHIPASMLECLKRLHKIDMQRTPIIGGRTQRNTVPVMNMQHVKVQLLRQVGFNLEAELVAIMKPAGDHMTIIEGMARLSITTVRLMMLYLTIIPLSILYLLNFEMLSMPDESICVPLFASIWMLPLISSSVRVWLARQYLIKTLIDALEVE